MIITAAIDWTNAVWIPVVISLLVGIPLALYTGLVSSRWSAFTQARMQAQLALQQGSADLKNAETPVGFMFIVAYGLNPARFVLEQLGHRHLAVQIQYLVYHQQVRAVKLAGIDITPIPNTEFRTLALPDFPQMTTSQFQRWKQVMQNRFFSELPVYVEYIGKTSPCYIAIFIAPCVSNWVRQDRFIIPPINLK